MDYLELFQTKLHKLKRAGSNGQYIALCPYHEDRKPSFSVNVDTGLWNCKSCGVKGNAYQFAKDMDMDKPHQYIEETNGYIKPYEPIQHDLDCETLLVKYLDNLDTYSHTLPESEITLEVLSDLGIGFDDNGNLVFSYWKDGKVVGFKHHKVRTAGYAKNHWYHSMKIPDFRHDKPLIICEGEKDIIPLIQWGNQAVTNTGGAKSIPKIDNDYDLKVFQEFESIHICYDNDDAGREGSDNLSKVLRDAYPTKPIKVYQWANDLPDKWDIWDSFTKNKAECFYDAQSNAKSVEINNKIGGLKLINGFDATKMNVMPKKQIIQNLLPEQSQIIFGGTTGSNKSFMAMQMGMSLANDESEFLGFKINVKGLKVLYLDTECGENVFVSRYKMLQETFNWKGSERFHMLTGSSGMGNVYDSLETAIQQVNPDIVIIDCLYNTTEGADISKNHHIQPIIKRITKIKEKYQVTIIAIHHMNKGGHELGLTKDRVSGGSALQNWAEHMFLITKTNEQSKRLLKIDKSRHIDYPECYYELEWNSDKKQLINVGVCADYKKLLIGNDKKYKWEKVLNYVEDEFTTAQAVEYITTCMGKSERTAYEWLREMKNCNVIKSNDYGKYEKKLKLVGKD